MQLLLIILNNILCTVVYLIMWYCILYYVVLCTVVCGIGYYIILYWLLYYTVLFTVLLLYTLASLTCFMHGKTFSLTPVILSFSVGSQLHSATLRCLSVDNSLLSIDNPSCSSTSQPSNTAILIWFSIRKKLLQNFLGGTQGGGGGKGCRKVQ